MDRQDQLQQVFRKVFQRDDLIISGATTAKDIRGWDSLTHLELISSIEEEYHIQFSFDEVMGFNSVRDLLSALENKLRK